MEVWIAPKVYESHQRQGDGIHSAEFYAESGSVLVLCGHTLSWVYDEKDFEGIQRREKDRGGCLFYGLWMLILDHV